MNLTVAFDMWRLSFGLQLSTSYLGFYADTHVDTVMQVSVDTKEELGKTHYKTFEVAIGVLLLTFAWTF